MSVAWCRTMPEAVVKPEPARASRGGYEGVRRGRGWGICLTIYFPVYS